MEQHFTIRIALAVAFSFWASAAFGQCTGVFPANTVCGNLSGSPAPPSAQATGGLISGPGSSTLNGLPLWANTAGTQLKDGAGQTIAGNYTWGGAQTYNALANFTSTFQIGGVTVTLPITVPNGGSGLATRTAHSIQVGNGAGNLTQAPVGTAGQPLISGGAGADPSFQTSAVLQATPANPTGTTNGTGVMMGLGATCKLTPVFGSRILIQFYGDVSNTGVFNNFYTLKFGTGTAPVNGAAFTGTTIGAQLIQVSSTGANAFQISTGGIAAGLTAGTAYWFDLDYAVGGGTWTMTNLSCTAMEF